MSITIFLIQICLGSRAGVMSIRLYDRRPQGYAITFRRMLRYLFQATRLPGTITDTRTFGMSRGRQQPSWNTTMAG